MNVFILFLLLVLPLWAGADVPDAQKPEVDYLINALETSECEMLRNGKAYNGTDAAKHVRRKYNHFKNQISSTEQFIELSATKSTMSGKDYWIKCPGQNPMLSEEWLLDLLQVFRES